MYMSEIVEAEKLPKKFCFAKKDDMQIKITGEEHSGPLIEGDFKTKEVTRVRIFKANRITDGDIRLKVVFLPAYMDNILLDIQIYEFSEKTKKSKAKAACLYEEQAPSKIVSIGSIIKQRPSSTKTRTPSRTPSTSSGGRNPNMSTFNTPEADPEPEEPKRAVKDILTDLQDKNESELTEEEVRVARHRRMLLAMLAREDEEEQEQRRSQIIPDGATFEGDEVDGADGTNDGDDQDDNDDKDVENDDDDDDDDDDSDVESVDARGEGDGDVLDEVRRPRSPGDGSTYSAESENNESVFVDTPPEPVRQRPRIPTRRTPGLSYDHSLSSTNAQPLDQEVNKPTKKSPPPIPVKPKPALPAGQKPPISPNKPVVSPREPALNHPVVPHVSTKISQARVVSASDPARFATIQDFPEDLRGLTIDDICKALEFLSLDKYKGQIRDNKIDGEMASDLSEDMLKSDLGLSGLEAKKLHKFIHHNWRPV
nr:uncharacterized protein LOC129267012 [Lytechinus pictus]